MLFRLTAMGPASAALRSLEEGRGLRACSPVTQPQPSLMHMGQNPGRRQPCVICTVRLAHPPPGASAGPSLPASGGPRPCCGLWHKGRSGPRHPRVLIRQESTALLSAVFNVTQMWDTLQIFLLYKFSAFCISSVLLIIYRM